MATDPGTDEVDKGGEASLDSPSSAIIAGRKDTLPSAAVSGPTMLGGVTLFREALGGGAAPGPARKAPNEPNDDVRHHRLGRTQQRGDN